MNSMRVFTVMLMKRKIWGSSSGLAWRICTGEAKEKFRRANCDINQKLLYINVLTHFR